MTKREAEEEFVGEVLPSVVAQYGSDDHVAISQAWNDWTDGLQKDGRITQKQYDTWVPKSFAREARTLLRAHRASSRFFGIGLGQKTARDYFYQAHRQIADADQVFIFEILPTLTCEEFEKLAKKRPHVYEKYRGLVRNTKGC